MATRVADWHNPTSFMYGSGMPPTDHRSGLEGTHMATNMDVDPFANQRTELIQGLGNTDTAPRHYHLASYWHRTKPIITQYFQTSLDSAALTFVDRFFPRLAVNKRVNGIRVKKIISNLHEAEAHAPFTYGSLTTEEEAANVQEIGAFHKKIEMELDALEEPEGQDQLKRQIARVIEAFKVSIYKMCLSRMIASQTECAPIATAGEAKEPCNISTLHARAIQVFKTYFPHVRRDPIVAIKAGHDPLFKQNNHTATVMIIPDNVYELWNIAGSARLPDPVGSKHPAPVPNSNVPQTEFSKIAPIQTKENIEFFRLPTVTTQESRDERCGLEDRFICMYHIPLNWDMIDVKLPDSNESVRVLYSQLDAIQSCGRIDPDTGCGNRECDPHVWKAGGLDERVEDGDPFADTVFYEAVTIGKVLDNTYSFLSDLNGNGYSRVKDPVLYNNANVKAGLNSLNNYIVTQEDNMIAHMRKTIPGIDRMLGAVQDYITKAKAAPVAHNDHLSSITPWRVLGDYTKAEVDPIALEVYRVKQLRLYDKKSKLEEDLRRDQKIEEQDDVLNAITTDPVGGPLKLYYDYVAAKAVADARVQQLLDDLRDATNDRKLWTADQSRDFASLLTSSTLSDADKAVTIAELTKIENDARSNTVVTYKTAFDELDTEIKTHETSRAFLPQKYTSFRVTPPQGEDFYTAVRGLESLLDEFLPFWGSYAPEEGNTVRLQGREDRNGETPPAEDLKFPDYLILQCNNRSKINFHPNGQEVMNSEWVKSMAGGKTINILGASMGVDPTVVPGNSMGAKLGGAGFELESTTAFDIPPDHPIHRTVTLALMLELCKGDIRHLARAIVMSLPFTTHTGRALLKINGSYPVNFILGRLFDADTRSGFYGLPGGFCRIQSEPNCRSDEDGARGMAQAFYKIVAGALCTDPTRFHQIRHLILTRLHTDFRALPSPWSRSEVRDVIKNGVIAIPTSIGHSDRYECFLMRGVIPYPFITETELRVSGRYPGMDVAARMWNFKKQAEKPLSSANYMVSSSMYASNDDNIQIPDIWILGSYERRKHRESNEYENTFGVLDPLPCIQLDIWRRNVAGDFTYAPVMDKIPSYRLVA